MVVGVRSSEAASGQALPKYQCALGGLRKCLLRVLSLGIDIVLKSSLKIWQIGH